MTDHLCALTWSTLPAWVSLVLIAVYGVMVITAIVVVLSENRNPIRSLSWVIALLFLPGVGLIFYLFFGRSLKGQHMISRHNKRKMLNTFRPKQVDLDEQPLSGEEKALVKLARNLCSSFYSVNNEIEVFITGNEKFEALKHDLLAAREFIYLPDYLFSDDQLGHEIADILMK